MHSRSTQRSRNIWKKTHWICVNVLEPRYLASIRHWIKYRLVNLSQMSCVLLFPQVYNQSGYESGSGDLTNLCRRAWFNYKTSGHTVSLLTPCCSIISNDKTFCKAWTLLQQYHINGLRNIIIVNVKQSFIAAKLFTYVAHQGYMMQDI